MEHSIYGWSSLTRTVGGVLPIMASASQKKGRSSKSEHVLEKVDHKECIDDTIPLSATIMTYRILPSHVV